VECLFRDADRVMCERHLPGRAFSIILQGEQVLPPVCSNLMNQENAVSADASLTAQERHLLEYVASMAGVALGVSGLAQVEVVLDDRGRAWVLEVNPQPCLKEDSAAHRAAKQAGLSYADLCQWMVQDCLLAESLR
jgi:D-alanine-D-alanine ligase-like ATP-grasp enzyme